LAGEATDEGAAVAPPLAPAGKEDPAGAAAPAAPETTAPSTFEDFYRRDYARMLRVAHLLTGSNETAEDVVQDAFVQLYPRFGTVGDAGGYVYRSVINGCWGRQRHRRVVERLRHLTIQPDAITSEIDETWAALRRLSPRRRAVVVLRFYADLTLTDIAAILDCRLGTVKSMLHRALAELKEVIEP
jgi:RNA polymerase sigma factor (sigma-70 family)